MSLEHFQISCPFWVRCGDHDSGRESCEATFLFFSVSSDKLFVLQLAVWVLRGVSLVAYANNPLCGALIMAALCWESPWQCLLGTLGVLTSTITAVVLGQDRWCSPLWTQMFGAGKFIFCELCFLLFWVFFALAGLQNFTLFKVVGVCQCSGQKDHSNGGKKRTKLENVFSSP